MGLMEWGTLLGNIGEFIGSIGVLATLAYLAVQIRQQNVIAQYNVWNSLSQEHKRTCERYINDPTEFQIYRRGLDQPDSLTGEDRIRFIFVMRSLYNDFLKAWQAHRRGLLPDQDWEVQATVFAEALDTPGGREWRATNSNIYPEFFAEIDRFKGRGTIDYHAVDLGKG